VKYETREGKDILIRHKEATGSFVHLEFFYPYRTGYWFATRGFNSPAGNASNGERCLR
jgi:hypothetical protein